MEILDKSGLTHFSQKLSKTNKVISLKCISVDKYMTAVEMMDPMITVVGQNLSKFYRTNNTTLVLKDNNNIDRGVAQYIGNCAPTQGSCVGYIDMYVFDSGNAYAQAKIMLNNGKIKKMS